MRPHFSLPFGAVYTVTKPPSPSFAPGQRVAFLNETFSSYDGDYTYAFATEQEFPLGSGKRFYWTVRLDETVDPADYLEPADTRAYEAWPRRLGG